MDHRKTIKENIRKIMNLILVMNIILLKEKNYEGFYTLFKTMAR